MIYHIKHHRVQHGNIYDDFMPLMQQEKADIFYSDPPWGIGNLKYWQTLNVKQKKDDISNTTVIDRETRFASRYLLAICVVKNTLKCQAKKDDIESFSA